MRTPVLLVLASSFAVIAACGAQVSVTAPATGPDNSKANWLHDGYLVVANQADATAELIDLKTGRSLKKIPTGTGPHEAAISDDGMLAAITNYGAGSPGNSLTIARIPSGAVILTIDLGQYTRPHGIAWLDADRVLVTSETTQNVVQVNVTEGKVEKAFATGNAGSHMLALDRGGKKVYTANISAANVTAIDLNTGQKTGDASAAQASEGIAVSPDGKWIVTGNRSGSISVIETAGMKKTKDIACEGVPYRAAFTPDSKKALVPCPGSKELAVVDMSKLEIEKKIKMSSEAGNPNSPLAGPRGVFINPNGKYAYVTLNESSSVAIVDLEKMEVVGQIGVGKSPDGVAFGKVP